MNVVEHDECLHSQEGDLQDQNYFSYELMGLWVLALACNESLMCSIHLNY